MRTAIILLIFIFTMCTQFASCDYDYEPMKVIDGSKRPGNPFKTN